MKNAILVLISLLLICILYPMFIREVYKANAIEVSASVKENSCNECIRICNGK